MTDSIWQLAASNVLFSFALALIAVVVGVVVKRPAIAHLLWLLVLLKMVTPPVVRIPLSFIPWAPGTAISTVAKGDVSGISPEVGMAPDEDPGAQKHFPARVAPLAGAHGKQQLLFAWLLGSVCILAWSLFQAFRFHGLIEREALEGDETIQGAAKEIAARFELRSVPKIHIVSARISPMVWWIGGRVWVVIPSIMIRQMNAQQLFWILAHELAHELAHVRRKDYLVRWIEWLACVCFWWNPVALWARCNLRANEELCCDAMVLTSWRLDPYVYGDSFLNAVKILSFSEPCSPMLASGMNGSRLLQKRVRGILSFNIYKSTPRWLYAGILAAAIAVTPLGLTAVQTHPSKKAENQRTIAAGFPEEYVAKGACPGEGCTYGQWIALKDLDVYEEPNAASPISGRFSFGDHLLAHAREVHVKPGRAIAPHPISRYPGIKPGRELFILDYIGEGRSRVFQNDAFFGGVKIARTKSECNETSRRENYCWAEILEEPVAHWWVFLESPDGKIAGWALNDGDSFATGYDSGLVQDSFRAVIDDPDGYTNVRTGQTVQSRIKCQIRDGDPFICFPVSESNWWQVITPARVYGYVHKSRIKRRDPEHL